MSHWFRFCGEYGEPVDVSGDVPVSALIEYFLLYLTRHKSAHKKRVVCATTADQYVSHVIKWLLDNEFISARQSCRSDRSRDIIKGLMNLHPSSSIAPRLRCKIPCTYHILEAALSQALLLASSVLDSLATRAALSLGYALSLRPSEYLFTSSRCAAPWRCAHSSLAFFWFPGHKLPFSVCTPDAYPPGVFPSDFTLFLDYNKNHQRGTSGPRSMCSAPSTAPFCCLRLLFNYLSRHPPLPDSPLLSGGGHHVTTASIRRIFHATAIALGLDPSRLVCHSLRAAALSQMMAFDTFNEQDFLATGSWRSSMSMRPYAHKSLLQARRRTSALYDPTAHPLEMTRLTFTAAPSI